MSDISCSFCGKVFRSRAGLAAHLAKTESHHFKNELEKEWHLVYRLYGEEYVNSTIDSYKNQELCMHDIYKSGKDIGKLITLLGLKRNSKEERQTERYKATLLKGIQSAYGDQITNVSQVKSVQDKVKDTLAKHHGSYENYLESKVKSLNSGYEMYVGTDKHEETLKKIKSTCLERYGNENFGAGDDARKKNSESQQAKFSKMSYQEKLEYTSVAREAVCHRGGYSSGPEKRVRKSLTSLGIEFQTNVHLWNYNFDMVFDKTIIEVQGDMWHGNPKKYKATDIIMKKILVADIWAKDERKKLEAEKHGYKVIYVWEDEIRKRKDVELAEYIKHLLLT